MEKDGLIKRVKVSDKSNLMRLELTDKGIYMIKVARKSESIDWIFSFLTEEECQQLESILNKVLNNTKEYISKETRRAEFHVPSTWVNVKE
jgi:DNA-binding MarR family transcriptional regulator